MANGKPVLPSRSRNSRCGWVDCQATTAVQRTYSFRVYAISASGVWSNASNTVTATLLTDTTPPAKPVVSAADAGPTHVDLEWSYAGDDTSPRFDIYVNGQLRHGQVAGTAKRIVFLSVNTIEVYAVDEAGNRSSAARMTIDLRTP